MYDPARVGEGDRVGHFHENFEILVQALLPDDFHPRRAVDALHGIEKCAGVVRSQVVDWDNIRMV